MRFVGDGKEYLMGIKTLLPDFLMWLFQTPEVEHIIPDGYYLYNTSCFVNIFRIFYDFPSWPTYDCTVRIVPIYIHDIIVESSTTQLLIDPTLLVSSCIMLLAVSIMGITICELCNNKLIYLLQPIIDKIEKRLSYLKERNRLNTMNYHP